MENMDNYNQYGFDSDYARASSGLTLNQYVAKTFLWMFVGLMVTFGTAYLGYWSGLLAFVFLTPMVPVLLLVAELAVVLVLSARIHKLHVGTARVLFLLYAVLNGVVFSTYFLMFEMATLIYIFALTAVYFYKAKFVWLPPLYHRWIDLPAGGECAVSLPAPGRVGPHCVPDRYCAVFGYHRL